MSRKLEISSDLSIITIIIITTIIIIITSLAPISSKDQAQGIKQICNRKQRVSRQWMDEEARRLRRMGSIKEIGF